MSSNTVAAAQHSDYPLVLANHAKQQQQNADILSMRGQAHIPRHNTLDARPTASRTACLGSGRLHVPHLTDEACAAENHLRQAHLADVESTMWIQPTHSNCPAHR